MTTTEIASVDRDALRLLTVIEAAEYLALSRGAIYNLLNTGALTSIHIGRARRIPLGELQTAMNGDEQDHSSTRSVDGIGERP